jgi:hypothetical protein
MKDESNLVLRSKILYCTLNIENAINNLLAKHLLITDKKRTKNFSNKAGISFQSKINLLFDINVLVKDELLIIELLMNFRNKFLHDIKYTSFTILLNDFDDSIQKRFFKFLNNIQIKTEVTFDKAFQTLYEKIVTIINEKIKEVDYYSNKKIEFLSFQMQLINTMTLSSLSFIENLNDIIENTKDISTKEQLLSSKLEFERKMNFKENVEIINSYSSEKMIKTILK